jgi:Hint domain
MPTTFTWKPGTYGGNWTQPANWSSSTYPQSGDTAQILTGTVSDGTLYGAEVVVDSPVATGDLVLGGTVGQLPQVVVQGSTLAVGAILDSANTADPPLQQTSFSGGGDISLVQGATLTVAGPVASDIYVNFIGSGDELVLSDPSAFQGRITNFEPGDAVVLANTAYQAQATLTQPGVGVYQVSDPNGGGTFDFYLAPGTNAQVGDVSGNLAIIACFVPGTRLLAERGEVAVEDIVEGDCLVTFEPRGLALGPRQVQRVCWVGRRRLEPTRHPRPVSMLPIRVRRDAFAPGVPARDLLLSPDHGIFAEGVLIPARYLVNGRTVIRESALQPISYYHVEVPRHAVLMADGLPAESYLDNGDRGLFERGGRVIEQYSDLSMRRWEADACAPIKVCGLEVEAVRRHLVDRASRLALAPAA